MSELKLAKGKIFTLPFLILFILATIALVFIIERFMYGIGAVSKLNDGYPWGMWIVYDVVTGTRN